MSIRNHGWSLMSPNITSEFRTERRKQSEVCIDLDEVRAALDYISRSTERFFLQFVISFYSWQVCKLREVV